MITDTLDERQTRYGDFLGDASVAQDLKFLMRETADANGGLAQGWASLDPDMKEALEQIATKVGRILHGDAWYDDSWRDISGYATLVLQRLEKLKKEQDGTEAL